MSILPSPMLITRTVNSTMKPTPVFRIVSEVISRLRQTHITQTEFNTRYTVSNIFALKRHIMTKRSLKAHIRLARASKRDSSDEYQENWYNTRVDTFMDKTVNVYQKIMHDMWKEYRVSQKILEEERLRKLVLQEANQSVTAFKQNFFKLQP